MFYEEDQMSMFAPDTWSGKMSPEPSAPTEAKTSQQSLKKRSVSQSRKPPIFQCLKKDGLHQDASGMSWVGGALPGEFSMHSFGEHPISLYHNGVGESHLSQILEDSPHQRYSLSAKACLGILNRANKRGKKLPEMLEQALVEQSLAPSKSEEDAVGGGKGALIQEDKSATLSTLQDQTLFQPVAYSIENHPADSRVDIDETGKVQTLTSRMGTGGGNVPMVMEPITVHGESISGTLLSRDYKGAGRWDSLDKVVCHPVACVASCASNAEITDGSVSPCLLSRAGTGGNNVPSVAFNVAGVDCRNATEYPEVNATLQSDASHNLNSNNVVRVKHIVRRLTPLECERLQGFPDGWTDIGEWVDSNGKKHKEADSPRYKALGNSIALPPWKWVLKRLCACYERDATMASLFDGIGGFPYIWEQLNGKGSCLWASEIEEFPMAVTKLRFGG